MKKLRKPYFAYILASLILFASCENNSLIENESGLSKYSSEDIFEGIFFFNNDFAKEIKVISNSSLYRELEKYTNTKKGLKDATKLILNKINKNDPSFFENFENLIKSGNHYKIKSAIALGTEKILETYDLLLKENNITQEELSAYIIDNRLNEFLEKDGSLNKEKLNQSFETLNQQYSKVEHNSKSQQGKCVVFGIVFFAGVAVLVGAVVAVVAAVNGGVVVNLAAAAFGWVKIAIYNDDEERKSSSNLALEMLINEIALGSKS